MVAHLILVKLLQKHLRMLSEADLLATFPNHRPAADRCMLILNNAHRRNDDLFYI